MAARKARQQLNLEWRLLFCYNLKNTEGASATKTCDPKHQNQQANDKLKPISPSGQVDNQVCPSKADNPREARPVLAFGKDNSSNWRSQHQTAEGGSKTTTRMSLIFFIL
jgi:hypothetical protein